MEVSGGLIELLHESYPVLSGACDGLALISTDHKYLLVNIFALLENVLFLLIIAGL